MLTHNRGPHTAGLSSSLPVYFTSFHSPTLRPFVWRAPAKHTRPLVSRAHLCLIITLCTHSGTRPGSPLNRLTHFRDTHTKKNKKWEDFFFRESSEHSSDIDHVFLDKSALFLMTFSRKLPLPPLETRNFFLRGEPVCNSSPSIKNPPPPSPHNYSPSP